MLKRLVAVVHISKTWLERHPDYKRLNSNYSQMLKVWSVWGFLQHESLLNQRWLSKTAQACDEELWKRNQ
jgi:hypothetical protein